MQELPGLRAVERFAEGLVAKKNKRVAADNDAVAFAGGRGPGLATRQFLDGFGGCRAQMVFGDLCGDDAETQPKLFQQLPATGRSGSQRQVRRRLVF